MNSVLHLQSEALHVSRSNLCLDLVVSLLLEAATVHATMLLLSKWDLTPRLLGLVAARDGRQWNVRHTWCINGVSSAVSMRCPQRQEAEPVVEGAVLLVLLRTTHRICEMLRALCEAEELLCFVPRCAQHL